MLQSAIEKIQVSRLTDAEGKGYATLYPAHIKVGDICMLRAPEGNVQREKYAEVIADALNVYRQTGLDASELLRQLRQLREAVDYYLDDHKRVRLQAAFDATRPKE